LNRALGSAVIRRSIGAVDIGGRAATFRGVLRIRAEGGGVKVGIISVFVDYHRRGRKNRAALQPQIGPLLAGLLPRDAEVEYVNEAWRDPDWRRDYDLLFISSMHSDFDRARQISHYWRRRGAKTVYGGSMASSYPRLCRPYFDAVVVGDPEGAVPQLCEDFRRGALRPLYHAKPYDAQLVPTPRFDLMVGQAHHALCFEASRGCPFECEFCVLTGLGARHHTRPVERVLRDIALGQAALKGRVPDYQRRIVGFCDNNFGGNLSYLRELTAALAALDLQWYGAATFNVISRPELVRQLARSGCRGLFVGLESFNPAAIADMRKHQNAVHKVRAALEDCRNQGILIVAGLMLSPRIDGLEYVARLPRYLAESGLHVPTFLCFEAPIPGTPHFARLARERPATLLPNALLRDFTGYTLVVQPACASPGDYVAAYRSAVRAVFAPRRRLAKLCDDLPRFLRKGLWLPALLDAGDMLNLDPVPLATRSLLAGSDSPPPESVPFDDDDFVDDGERRAILEPWRVTDEHGFALDAWLGAQTVFDRRQAKSIRTAGRSRAAALVG
jgi:hypothetical protein